MIQPTRDILDAALSLGEKDRAFIAQRLIESLDGVESELSQEEIDRAWVEEIKRRRDDIRKGRTELLDGEDVVAEIREELHRGAAK